MNDSSPSFYPLLLRRAEKKEKNSPNTVLGLPPLFRSSCGACPCCSCSLDPRRFMSPAVRCATSGEAERGSLEVVAA